MMRQSQPGRFWWKFLNKKKGVLFLPTVIAVVVVLLVSSSNFASATKHLTDSSGTPAALNLNPQRKVIYDSVNNSHSVFDWEGSGSDLWEGYESSPGNWQSTSLSPVDTSDYSVLYLNGVKYLAYVSSGVHVEQESGVGGFTNLVNLDSTSTDEGVSITADSNSRIWVTFADTAGGIYGYRATNPNSTASWSAKKTIETSAQNYGNTSVVPLTTSGDVYVMWERGAAGNCKVKGERWVDGSSAFSGTIDTIVQIGSATCGNTNAIYSATSNSSNLIHMLYQDQTGSTSSGAIKYIEYSSGAWGSPITLDSNTTNQYPSISTTVSGKLYAFWIRSNIIDFKRGASPYGAGNWDASPTAAESSGTNTSVNAIFNNAGDTSNMSFAWYDSGNIYFDQVADNASPNAPTATSPTLAAKVPSTTPSLIMNAVDPEGDSVKYRLYLYQGSSNDGTNCTSGTQVSGSPWDQTLSGTGWNNGTTAYASGASATFTVPTTLSDNVSYCWQAQAIDPTGSNSFGPLSTRDTFTVNLPPSAPTLSTPANNATGVNITPQFTLSSTDSDVDYIQYEIQVCSTSNCSSVVRTICQNAGLPNSCSASQVGWTGQSLQSGTAYSTGQMAVHNYQPTALSSNTQYWWRAYAIDPGGSNTASSASSIYTFTTENLSTSHDTLFQGNVCFGGC